MNPRHFLTRSLRLQRLSLLLLLCIAGLVYLPGLWAPYLFDDYSNLLDNQSLQPEQLDFESIWRAAFSLSAGPFQRPVAMASFALNSYLSGGFGSPVPFRIVNIAIHVLNGILIYFLFRLVLVRIREVSAERTKSLVPAGPSIDLLTAFIALLWLVHPINLTSVLYVVQRMTSLAAMFTLLALLCYLAGRLRLHAGQLRSGWILLAAVAPLGVLGVLSKETALLLPVFIMVMEFCLFRNEFPLNRWIGLSPRSKWLAASALVVLIIAVSFAAIQYAAPGYNQRTFTMVERVLTEPRVLVFYLSLIAFPRLDEFGMFHDDIPISHSLFNPPSTFIAIIFLIGLVCVGIALRRRAPLVTLGLGWFFAAHLIESTIFPLEIAHEHRNYLASLVLPLILAAPASSTNRILNYRWRLIAIIGISICFAAVTVIRSSQWVSAETLYRNEVRHHPNSAAANAGLGVTLINNGQISEGIASLRRAAELEPSEPGTLINITLISVTYGAPLSQHDLDEIDARLLASPVSATTLRSLQTASECVITRCRALAPHMERWIHKLMDNTTGYSDPAYYLQLLGSAFLGQQKINEAIDAFRKSYEMDPNYVIPLFDIAQIYLSTGHFRHAETIAKEIRRANERVPVPRHRELAELERQLSERRSTLK